MLRCFILLISMLFAQNSWSQTDTIRFDNAKLSINQLSSGKNSYLTYRQDTFVDAAIYDISIWERTIHKTADEISLKWKWTIPDSATYIDKTISVSGKNLKPLRISWTNWSKGVKGNSFAFDFQEKALKSDSDTSKHTIKAMEIPYKFLAFCWELDLEFFSTLPLEVDKTFAIPFYHPGGTPPAYLNYTVLRKEMLSLGNNEINTFLLRHYHKDTSEFTDWWIDENSFKVLKMKSRYGDTYRYKIILL